MILDVDTIYRHLPSYGYTPTDKDRLMIQNALEISIHRALSFTNQKKMPKGLEYEVVNMAVAEFLYMKKITGGLDDGENGIGFKAHITQFTEGDTNLSAADKGKNNESNFEDWVGHARFGNPYVLEHFRRLHW